MGTLTTAYALAWIVISTYLMSLGRRSRQLSRRLENLERITNADSAGSQNKRAA